MPMRLRTAVAETPGAYNGAPRYSTWPSTRAPATRSFSRFSVRSTVVLPHPDGPMKAVISCSYMVSETSVTALKALYQIEVFATWNTTSPVAGSTESPAGRRAADATGGRLVTVLCSGSVMTSLARVLGESCRDDPGDDHQDEGDGDERERRAPAAALGTDIGRRRIPEDL